MLDQKKAHERNNAAARMQVRIFLDRPGYECLSEHLAHGSKSRSVADKNVLLGNTRVVECTATEARQLLRDARQRCPDAVSRIIEGIHAAGLIAQTTALAIKTAYPAGQAERLRPGRAGDSVKTKSR
jgi:hypothetical protein